MGRDFLELDAQRSSMASLPDWLPRQTVKPARDEAADLIADLKKTQENQERLLLIMETKGHETERRFKELSLRIHGVEQDIKRFMHWAVISLIAFVAQWMLQRH